MVLISLSSSQGGRQVMNEIRRQNNHADAISGAGAQLTIPSGSMKAPLLAIKHHADNEAE